MKKLGRCFRNSLVSLINLILIVGGWGGGSFINLALSLHFWQYDSKSFILLKTTFFIILILTVWVVVVLSEPIEKVFID